MREEQAVEERKLQKVRELAKLALDDLFFFNQYILGNGSVMNEELHREMCDFASGYRDFKNGKKKRLLMEPRFTLKSTCVTIAYTLQQMAKNPNCRILISSENLSQAKSFLASIKGHCETNERYRDLCKLLYGKSPVPLSKLDEKWTSTELVSPLRTDRSIKEPTVSTAGVDVVKVGQHYDIVIMDDPVSNNNTTTREQMEKVITNYKLILSLLDPGGQLIIIGTRYDYGDLYGYIIENNAQFFDILIRSAWKKDGTLTYPEKLTEEFLSEQKISQGGYLFSCQYLNNPVPRDDATFRWDYFREWMGEFDTAQNLLRIEELRKFTSETQHEVISGKESLPVNVFLTIDPAVSATEQSDPTAMVVTAVDRENRLFVIEYINERLPGMKFYDSLFRLIEKYRPRRVGVETSAFQKSLIYTIRDEMRKRNTFFTLEELKADKDKVRRIEALQPRYEAGQIYLKKGMDELKYQMVNFPRTVHDDIIDALAYQLQIIFPKRKERDPDERKRRDDYIFKLTRY